MEIWETYLKVYLIDLFLCLTFVFYLFAHHSDGFLRLPKKLSNFKRIYLKGVFASLIPIL